MGFSLLLCFGKYGHPTKKVCVPQEVQNNMRTPHFLGGISLNCLSTQADSGN